PPQLETRRVGVDEREGEHERFYIVALDRRRLNPKHVVPLRVRAMESLGDAVEEYRPARGVGHGPDAVGERGEEPPVDDEGLGGREPGAAVGARCPRTAP